jgi:hypothetical protein
VQIGTSNLFHPWPQLFLTEKLSTGLEKRTVRNIQAAFRAMLNAALEDGIIIQSSGEARTSLKIDGV